MLFTTLSHVHVFVALEEEHQIHYTVIFSDTLLLHSESRHKMNKGCAQHVSMGWAIQQMYYFSNRMNTVRDIIGTCSSRVNVFIICLTPLH